MFKVISASRFFAAFFIIYVSFLIFCPIQWIYVVFGLFCAVTKGSKDLFSCLLPYSKVVGVIKNYLKCFVLFVFLFIFWPFWGIYEIFSPFQTITKSSTSWWCYLSWYSMFTGASQKILGIFCIIYMCFLIFRPF